LKITKNQSTTKNDISSNEVKMHEGLKLTMRKSDVGHLQKENFRELEWFRPPGAEAHDGCRPAKGTCKITKELNLSNLGSETVRKAMPNATSLTRPHVDKNMKCARIEPARPLAFQMKTRSICGQESTICHPPFLQADEQRSN